MLGNDKVNSIDALISKALIDWYISHDEFLSVNNELREYNEKHKEIKKICVIYYIKTMTNYCVSCKKNKKKFNP